MLQNPCRSDVPGGVAVGSQHHLPHHVCAPVCLLMHPLMGPLIQPLMHSLLGPYSSLNAHSANTLQRLLWWAREPTARACPRGLNERCGMWLAPGGCDHDNFIALPVLLFRAAQCLCQRATALKEGSALYCVAGLPTGPSSRQSLWKRFYIVHPCSSVVYSQHSKHSAAQNSATVGSPRYSWC